MTIVEKIIKSIKGYHGDDFQVYYHDEPMLNLLTSEMQFPCALLVLLTSGTVTDDGGQYRERVNAAVFFVEPQRGMDFDAVANERIIDRCKRRALSWLAQLSGDGYITASLTRTARVYEQYDDILTGYGLFLDVTELVGYDGCEPCPSDFNGDFSDDFGGLCPDFNDDFNNDFL